MKTLYTTYNNFAKRAAIILTLLLTLGVTSVWGAEKTVTLDKTCFKSDANNYQETEGTIEDTSGGEWKVKGYGMVEGTSVTLGKGNANYLQTPNFSGNISKIKVTCSGSYYLQITDNNGNVVCEQQKVSDSPLTYTVSGSYSQLKLFSKRFESTSNAATTITEVVVTYNATPACEYTVNFDGNGNTSGSMLPQYFTCGEYKALTDNAFTRTGYTFAGWATSANGSVAYTNQESVNLSSKNNDNITLFAQWQINSYKVTWKPNGGNWSGNASDKVEDYNYGATITTPSNPSRYGYNFTGWTPTPATTMPASDQTYTAQWTEKSLTNYRTTCSQTIQLDAPTKLSVTNITSTSATLSWDAVENASSYTVELLGENKDPIKTFSNLNAITITISDLESSTNYILGVVAVGDGSTYLDSEQTLSDVFTTASATCKVTYNANGGEGTITDATEYTNGATVTVLGNFGEFTNEGCAFTGWNTKKDGTGNDYKHNETFTITTNTTLYAQWCKAYWKLVTDESELENDTRIVIAAKDENYALSTDQKINNRGQAEITKKYNTITFGADVQTLSLIGLHDNKFALYTGSSGYLCAAGSNSSNYLKTGTNTNGNGDWSIGFSIDGTATILAQGTYTNNQLKYNAGSDLFSCYGSTNSQKDVVIYKEVCKEDSYNVTSNLTNATAVNGNPTTVSATATSLTLKYSANTGYLLPETITVKMGGVALSSTDDYTWNKEDGQLELSVDGFYGEIDVKIVAESDPCYGFEMSEVSSTSTANSITLTWGAVDGATGYKVRIGEEAFKSTSELTYAFTGLNANKTYNWEVQAIKGDCQASKIGSTTTQKETFTVKWVVNGDTENPVLTEDVVDGDKIKDYPSTDPSAPSGCDRKVFVGWTDKTINKETDDEPAPLYTQKNDVPVITANTTLHAVWADEKRVEGQPLEVEETASVNISSYASANSWSNSTQYLTVNIDENITAIADGGASTGKYYTSGNTWRFYRSDNGKLTINAADGCTIKTIKVTYTVDDSGVLTYNSSNKESGSEISINATSATFGVGNTNSATNGKVFITAISVTYTTTTKGPDVITYSAYTTLCDECTPSDDLVLEASANTADLDINGKATITFSTTGGNGGAITYTANPKNGVSWENGVATFTKSGEYEITATQEKNGNYCPTVSNTLDVTITAIPHLYFTTEPNPTTIVFDPVECGGNTRVEDKKSVSVQAYNLAAAVTVTVTGPYKIARTSGATLNEYDTKLTLDKNQEGHINGNYDDVYILSFPPAGSSEPTEGTLTFTTTNGNGLTVSLSTPTITCTPCTLTFNDRGIKTTQEYYAGTEVPEPATPTGVCGEYEFDGWALAKVESGSTTYEKVEFPYIMPANNQTVLYAVYRYLDETVLDTQYELVTSVESGKDYVLAAFASSKYYALNNSIVEGNSRDEAESIEVAVSNDILTCDNATAVWNIQGNPTAGYTFYNASANGYLNMLDKDYSSDLSIQADKNNATLFTFEFTGSSLTILAKNHTGSCPYLSFNSDVKYYTAFRNSSVPLYLFKQLATTYYTTNPDCHPTVTLTSDGEVYVTATNGRGIMAATPLTLTTTDLAPNTEIAISSNSGDIYFSTERNTNFAMVAANQPQKSLTLTTNEGGELEKQLYIHYKPSADGNGTPAEVVVTADVSTHNPPFTAQKTIHVRNMPAEFVIATKAGATWYALPANMGGATNPAAVVIEVDETTMTATAPNTTPYTLFPVKTTNGSGDRYTQYGDRVRFSAINYEYRGLWANNNATEQTIRNFAVIDGIGDDGEAAYEWKVTTTIVDGNWQYTLYSDQKNNKNHLCYSMNQENPAWGTYASNEAQYQLYFLPIKAETTPFDYQVVEWYPNKVLIHTTTAFSSLTAKIAGEQVANVQYTSKDANQYEVTGLPLMKNPAKALTLEFVVADATHTGIHTIPVMLSGGEHTISGLPVDKGIYNNTNLVVRDGAKLTVDGETAADNTFYDVTIYPTAKIVVPEGKKLSLHSLTFIGGITEVYDGEKYVTDKYAVPELSLKGTLGKTVTTIDYLMRVDLSQMYSLALPYDVALGDITYGDGSAIELGTQLYVSAYDGAARAQNLGAHKNWVYETDFATKFGSATLKAGVGYTISAQPQAQGDKYAILRLPMTKNINSGGTEVAKSVAVTAHGKDMNIADNHKGWNLVANPYMASISGDSEEYSELMLRYMEMLPGGTWQWTGDNQRYVTIPYNDGSGYYQLKFSEAVLQPFKNFFVQVGETGTLDFVLTSRQNAPARYMEVQTEQEVEFELLLSNEKYTDNTGLLIAEQYSPAYEINADLEKMTGSMSVYTIYGGYKLAYNALNPMDAEERIHIGYIVPAVGEYTFELDENVDLEDFVHIYLIDNETGVVIDLIDNTYTFETSVKKSESRFAINVVLRSDAPGTATGMDNMRWNSDQPQKFIYDDKIYILYDGTIYDANGKRVKTIND